MGQHCTFAEWLERRGYSPKTIRMYAGWQRRLDQWLSLEGRPPLRLAGAEDIGAFSETTPATYGTRSSLRNGLTAWWAFSGRTDSCPVWTLRVPRAPEGVCRALPDGAVEKLLVTAEAWGPVEHAVVCLLYYQAMRREEVVSLPWYGFETEPGWMRFVGKGNREGRLPVHEQVEGALARLPRRGIWVFPSPRRIGHHLHEGTLNLWLRLIGAASGVGHVTPHQLRHSALARANDELGDLRAVQTFARHANPRTTARYTRTTERRLRDVLAVL